MLDIRDRRIGRPEGPGREACAIPEAPLIARRPDPHRNGEGRGLTSRIIPRHLGKRNLRSDGGRNRHSPRGAEGLSVVPIDPEPARERDTAKCGVRLDLDNRQRHVVEETERDLVWVGARGVAGGRVRGYGWLRRRRSEMDVATVGRAGNPDDALELIVDVESIKESGWDGFRARPSNQSCC